MKVTVANACCCVVFVARDMLSNAVCAMAASDATAASAARFLDRVCTVMPFAVEQIQTDGGSEFKGVFEADCKARGIPLYIIPPRSPKYNSKVENMNGTIRREVFNFRDDIELSIEGVQEAEDEFSDRYNEQRPTMALTSRDERGRLRYATPMEYSNAFLQSSENTAARIPI